TLDSMWAVSDRRGYPVNPKKSSKGKRNDSSCSRGERLQGETLSGAGRIDRTSPMFYLFVSRHNGDRTGDNFEVDSFPGNFLRIISLGTSRTALVAVGKLAGRRTFATRASTMFG